MEIRGVFGPTNAYRASFVGCRSGRKEGGKTLRFSLCSRPTLVCALGVQPQHWGGLCRQEACFLHRSPLYGSWQRRSLACVQLFTIQGSLTTTLGG